MTATTQCISPRDLASMLQVPLGTVYRLIKSDAMRDGKLPQGIRIGRRWVWRLSDVESWLDSRVKDQDRPRVYQKRKGSTDGKRSGRPRKADQIRQRAN